MEKGINYINRDFNSIKSELIKFSKQYYPTLATSFQDSSVGSWFIDLISAVGDDLSYSIDRIYQENNPNSAQLRSSVLNMARLNGIKVPGPKSSMVEVELSCQLPVDQNKPMWKCAPILKQDTQVGSGPYVFELDEDVDFGQQFNKDGYSNRKFQPNRDSNGAITSYTVTKNVMAVAGTTKIYKKVISENELEPFMEIILPEKNIMNVESIIFKSTTGLTNMPKSYEFYIDDEEYQIKDEYVKTYRFFEVNALSDLYRFGTETSKNDQCISGSNDVYVDYTESWEGNGSNSTRTTRVYKGKWKPITQKFITEYTDNGYLKIIFGASNNADEIPSASTYAEYRMSNLVNNVMLGVLPQAGWTGYIRYTVGGGVETNMAVGAINSFIFTDVEFPNGTDSNTASVVKSLKVSNLSNSVAGKDAPSTEELKNYIKFSVGSQERCVTVNDYKSRLAMMPPKYGCPFRYNAIEENNKIVMPFLCLTPDKKLDKALPNVLVDNVKEYMSNYKNLTDYLEMKSGKVFNLGFEVDVFIDKNYTTDYVIKTMIDKIQEYMDVENHMMGDSIFIGDLEKELNKLDGVISLIDLRVYNIYGGTKYGDNAHFPQYRPNGICSTDVTETQLNADGATIDRIDLDALDSVLENDYDSMFEIKNISNDVSIKCKLK